MLRLAGISDPEVRAGRIVALETKIAQAHWTRVQRRQVENLYNPMAKAELAAKMPGFGMPFSTPPASPASSG